MSERLLADDATEHEVRPTSSEPTNFQGTMSGNTITVDAAHGSGTLTVKGDEMTGMVYGIMPATVTLKRQR